MVVCATRATDARTIAITSITRNTLRSTPRTTIMRRRSGAADPKADGEAGDADGEVVVG